MAIPDRPAPAVVAASNAGGEIYDLGYRRYLGPRLGRRHAVRALFVHTLRGAFGIGRGGRAKIAPVTLLILAVLPALVSVGISALVGPAAEDFNPIRPETYYSTIQVLLTLFCAAQAPELVGRDQRYHVLSLYFSRALLRSDYALAKLAALMGALLVVALVPQLILFLGDVFGGNDLVEALGSNVGQLLPILASALVIALLLGSISLAISAYTPRRAYATAIIIGLILVSSGVVSALSRIATGEARRYVPFLSVDTILNGSTTFLFGSHSTNIVLNRANVPGGLYLAAALGISAVAIALVLFRYRKLTA